MSHSDSYVSPHTDCHTQGLERSWAEGSAYIKAARPSRNIGSNTNEIAWRALHRGVDLLSAVLRNAVAVRGAETARANGTQEVAKI